MKICLISLSILILFINSGCNAAAALIMAIPEKQGKEKWKTEDYKISLKKRQGWAGPPYYYLRFREKGMFHKSVKTTIGAYTKQECIYYLQLDEDSIRIDFCKHTIGYQTIEKLKVKTGIH